MPSFISDAFLSYKIKIMPHTLFELSTMTREQLESIAAEHGVKNVKKMDMEPLAFAILDAEAKEESLKPVPDKPKAKRGRPKKESPAASKAAPEAVKPASEAKPDEAPKAAGKKAKTKAAPAKA